MCSAARALELVGERWSLLMVRNALFAGTTRFTDFLRLGMATNVLASRLDSFVAAGIMARTDEGEYVLTDRGRDLAPVLVALTEWGDRWAAPDGRPVLYVHQTCGGAVSSRTECEGCGELTDLRELGVLPGPGMPAATDLRMR